MGIVGVLARAAQSHPALLPIVLASIAVAAWAFRVRRWRTGVGAILLGAVTSVLYTGALPALALSEQTAGPAADVPADPGAGPRSGAGEGPRDASGGRARQHGGFSSSATRHPRFPPDLRIPATFRLESNSGGSRRGTITARFRFRGEGSEAVRAFKELSQAGGWEIDVKAPHRLVLHKDGRIVEAWFSFAAHSVVLDIPDPR